MSVKVMGWVWDQDLPRDEKFILLAYADHADHDGYNVYPAIDTVAKKTGYTRRSVQLITKKIIKRGLLIQEGLSEYQTKKYRIPIDGGEKITPPTDGGEKINTKGVKKMHEGVKKTAKNMSQISPKPSVKPSTIKPSVKPSKGWDIPDHLNTPLFLEAWADFQQHRKEIKKKLTPLAGSRTLKKLSDHSVNDAIKMLEQSIENGWTGVFELKGGNDRQDSTMDDLQRVREKIRNGNQ